MTRVLIAFGGNLGNVRDCFIEARTELAGSEGIRLRQSSKLYRTPPLGPPGQGDYLNAVVAIETSLTAIALLDLLQSIETRHGRQRQPDQPRWGPRTLDLDLLDYGNTLLESDRLTLPHSGLSERLFVLRPLCDIAPGWQHPQSKVTAAELLQQLLSKGEVPLPQGEPW